MVTVLTKKDLAEKLAEAKDLTKKDATEVVNFLLEEISSTLKDGGNVELAGFGKFEVKERAAREVRNPQTGETIAIAASKVPSFKASKTLKDLVK